MDLNDPNGNIMIKRKEISTSSKSQKKAFKDFNIAPSKFEQIKEAIKNHPYSLKLK